LLAEANEGELGNFGTSSEFLPAIAREIEDNERIYEELRAPHMLDIPARLSINVLSAASRRAANVYIKPL
jgi:hypothetical protein